jgi:hypothetical protein
MALPPYVTRSLVAERLPHIFPEGTPRRSYCVRELAASTVFVALYIGALEGTGRYLGPIHVYRMTDEQADSPGDADREAYVSALKKKGHVIPGRRWYADNTREPIRDETLRDGLVAVGAVTRRADLPTTSGAPRYALKPAFAGLFDPSLSGPALDAAIADFQLTHLGKSALARIAIMRAGASSRDSGLLVTFPNGETRWLAPGPSSLIAQSVVEVFAKRFLDKPAVLWLSESGNKVVVRDDQIATAIGLRIQPDRDLPDLILADLGPSEPLLVFVEVVATDGAVTSRRQGAVHALTDAAGFNRDQVVFLTAYQDRQSPGFRKTVAHLAWNSFAWFASEPDNLVMLLDGSTSPTPLSQLLRS